MAWLEKDKRSGIYQVLIRLENGKLKRSLKTADEKVANAILGTVENTIRAINERWIDVPDNVDLGEFLISGGKVAAKQQLQRQLTLSELFDGYFASLPADSLEGSTINLMRIHERQLYAFFGKNYTLAKLSTPELQRYIERRSKDKGLRGRPVTIDDGRSELRASLERLTRQDEEAELRVELAKIQTHRESIVAMMRTLLAIEERIGRIETLVTEAHQIATNTAPTKEWYTVKEVAEIFGKAEFTVREWCRLGRINGAKRDCGRGRMREWIVSHEELARIQNQGLLAD